MIPCKDKKEATHISLSLLNKKLIACANIVPATSMYFWEGKIENSSEHILFIKTRKDLYKEVEAEILALHSYECPAISSWTVQCNAAYAAWIEKNTK